MMRTYINLSLVVFLSIFSVSQGFDFFYFVQQWPGSFCDLKKPCCYPTSGRPASDFGIRGLWPNFVDGSYASDCGGAYNKTTIEDITSSLETHWPILGSCPSQPSSNAWRNAWKKYGTCSELGQYGYFQAALDLKSKVDLLGLLEAQGIVPKNGVLYSLSSFESAIKTGFGDSFGVIRCNKDKNGTAQIKEVHFCVDKTATSFITCPVYPRGSCASEIQFPEFPAGSTSLPVAEM